MRSGRTSRALTPYLLAALAAIALVPFFSGDARAANTVTQRDRTKAQDLFKRSADAYRKGDFKEAIDLLTQAYALDPQPVMIYNLARAHEGLGNTDAAIDNYEKFLTQEPKTPDRGAIEQRLTTLRRQRDERNAQKTAPAPTSPPASSGTTTQSSASASAAPPPPPPPQPEPPPRAPSNMPYILGGAGLVGLGVGTVFGIVASSHESDAKSEPVQQKAIDDRDSGKTAATLANVSFVIGGVLVVAGVTWFVLDRSSKKSSATGLLVGPGYVGLQGGFQ